MNRGRTYAIHAALGAALVSALPGLAAAQTATPTPVPTATPTPTPTPTPRYELSADSGKVSGVGLPSTGGEPGNAIVKLTGGFVFDGPIDFFSSSVTLRSVLRERGGAGELTRGAGGLPILPTVLFRKSGNDNNVVFATPGSVRPTIRLNLRRKPDGVFLANLKISRATIPADPTLCAGTPPSTFLETVLLLSDAHNEPVTVAGTVEWRCELAEDKLRLPEGSGGGEDPPSTNKAPSASVRTNLLSRETGQPSMVLLDGSNSSDSDGAIASYNFRVALKETGALVFGPVEGPGAFATTTLPPGDYTALLVVTDNLGTSSSVGTRNFSIK